MGKIKSFTIIFFVMIGVSQAMDVADCANEFANAMQDASRAAGGAQLKAKICPILETYGQCLKKALGNMVPQEQLEQIMKQAMEGSSVQCDFSFLETSKAQTSTRPSSTGTTGEGQGGTGGNNDGEMTDKDQMCLQQYESSAKNVKELNDICPLLKKMIHCMLKEHPDPSDRDIAQVQDLINTVLDKAKSTCTVNVQEIVDEAHKHGGENAATSSFYVSIWQPMISLVLAMFCLRLGF